MALTRKMLKAMGIEEEKIDEIIEAHTDVVDSLKKERDTYKEDADKLTDVQKKLDDALDAAKNSDSDKLQVKYDALKEEYQNYKNDVEKKATHSLKEAAYREILKNAGISEKRIDTVVKVSDIDNIELDDNNKIKNADELTNSIKTEWADFIVTQKTVGANTSNPPENNSGTKLDELSMKDYIAARKKK